MIECVLYESNTQDQNQIRESNMDIWRDEWTPNPVTPKDQVLAE